MENNSIKISLTNTESFVITGRNKDNSLFYIRPKENFIKETESEGKKLVISTLNEGFVEEQEIIKKINSGVEFYTYFNNSFTNVIIVDEQIKTEKNNVTEDNIENLPVII